MMPMTSRETEILAAVHPDLKRVFEAVAERFPCRILEGMRTEERQKDLFAQGKSKTLNSKHLTGRAIDAAPLKYGTVDWEDIRLFAYFAGYVLGVADQMGVNLRHGADWDRDFDLTDTTFFDWPHFEVV
jgi:peptidoglycan L-alanyl-D-glutamate endopeptidase CwlK